MSLFACLGQDAVPIRDAYVRRLSSSVEVMVGCGVGGNGGGVEVMVGCGGNGGGVEVMVEMWR